MVMSEDEHEELASLVSSAVLVTGIGMTLILVVYILVDWYLQHPLY